ncbi:hypothetical protein J2D73_18730 [Acetobacter sacchari]|uniref:Uncharacterized protein n=1 Tax=Acetobacter sacchari TaxID=2661687 RepID=A0ABS3M0V8_9PROT|nr:hypothetical protein [Acetobacter sacchari]MBO1361822.1 hypothetical protein [Acetobacter sacchari]
MSALDEFRETLSAANPPEGEDLALQAIWWAGRGNWTRAHECAQTNEGDPDCDWAHAWLHRKEGDLGNARYWYRRAGRPTPTGSLEQEWEEIATALLARPLTAAQRRKRT